jgi:glycosylphosphatidylinositol transamidase (GPIT) subunit GPI8
MKFQDQEELMAADVADALAQMWGAGRYRELLLIVETCQAATMYTRISSPNVLAMAASQKGTLHALPCLLVQNEISCLHGHPCNAAGPNFSQ